MTQDQYATQVDAQWEGLFARLTGEEHDWVVAEPDDEDAVAVLVAVPDQVDRLASMPAEGVLSEAPMGDYDVFELSVFARPVARVRWCVDEDMGIIGAVTRVGDSELPDDEVVPVLVEAALDEATQDGADVVVAVVPAGITGPYQRAGWMLRGIFRAA